MTNSLSSSRSPLKSTTKKPVVSTKKVPKVQEKKENIKDIYCDSNARLKQYKYYFDIIGSTFKDIVQTVNPRRSHSSSNFSSVSLDKEDPDKTIEETSDYNRKREQIKKRRAHRQRSSSVSAVNKGSNLLTSLNSEFLMEIVNDKIKKSKESIDENFSLDLSKKVNSMVVDEYSPDKKNVDLVEEGKKFAIEFLRMRQRKK